MKARLAISLLAATAIGGCGEDPAPAQQPFQAQVQRVDAAGTEIAWYERGQGPALVMLMGTGSTMAE